MPLKSLVKSVQKVTVHDCNVKDFSNTPKASKIENKFQECDNIETIQMIYQ